MNSMAKPLVAVIFVLSLINSSPAAAWGDLTHMAVMKAAGLGDLAYLAVGADMAKEKAGDNEGLNHYRDNKKGVVVTPEMVLGEMAFYNCKCNEDGQLYGAILAASDQYYQLKSKNKFAIYVLGYAAHYIGDLSNPMHNVEYNDFNKKNHLANDLVVEEGLHGTTNERVARIARNIEQRMNSIPPYQLPKAKDGINNFNIALANKVAEIAKESEHLGFSMQESTPPRPVMTEKEAYRQLAFSARLLQAVYAATGP